MSILVRICIPIREVDLEKAQNQLQKALKKLKNRPRSLLEIWFDRIPIDKVKNLIQAAEKVPVVAVCRGVAEKGSFQGTEQERMKVLQEAVRARAALVDVGLETAPTLIRGMKKVCQEHGAKLIISHHNWENTPDLKALEKIEKQARELGADIVKIATMVTRWSDNVILFEFTRRMAAVGREVIIIGMGEKGKISRPGCPLLGSYLTYVALDEKSKTAPGQLVLH